MVEIKTFPFESESKAAIKELKLDAVSAGESWPVVYVINDDEEAYVGQTTNIFNRTGQHLDNPKKSKLTTIQIMSESDFNVSVALDLESYLIKHMGSDGRFTLINGNHGLKDHNYYERDKYADKFEDIWNQLIEMGLAEQSIDEIENTELFKYSPYKALGEEQVEIEYAIFRELAKRKESGKDITVVVRGGAGTGKTILAVYLMKLFADVIAQPLYLESDEEDEEYTSDFIAAAESIGNIEKIGMIIPQKPLRASLQEVFESVNNLNQDMVMDVYKALEKSEANGPFDLLIVDEGHRLKTRKNGGNYNLRDNMQFKKWCDKFELKDREASELDLLMKCSKNLIVFRDDKQTVRAADIGADQFRETVSNSKKRDVPFDLTTQWRCKGGKDYTDYVREIMTCKASSFLEVMNYDFKLYDDVDRMIKDIKELEEDWELCRVAAGYAWEWKTKGKSVAKFPKLFDIEIDGHKYRWNSTTENWIYTKNAINEIGCIHTVQGFDLNYLGVIIGEDIKYDKEKNCIVSDVNNYYDTLGLAGLTKKPEALRDYLVNIYTTLMTRGIHGTYVYVCDPALREYMSQFIEKA